MASLIDGVVIVPCKKVLHHVGAPEAAPLIEGHGQRTLPCAHLENPEGAGILLPQEPDHLSAVPLPLAPRFHGQILDLQDAVPLAGDHAHRSDRPPVLQRIHGPPVQVPLHHVLLLVRQQEQVHILTLVFRNLCDAHSVLPMLRCQSISGPWGISRTSGARICRVLKRR